jgi:hypothetical protein
MVVFQYIGVKIVFLHLSAMYWLERKNVTGGSRKLSNEDLHGICCSPDIIHVIE